jgi:hypothetical protein
MTDLITRARRAAGIAGNDVTGNLLIELVEEIEAQERFVNDTADQIAAIIAGQRPDDWAWPLHGLRDALTAAEARAEKAERERNSLAARLDRIEKWLTATHGYPYPGKD